jgi:hypothetical protein
MWKNSRNARCFVPKRAWRCKVRHDFMSMWTGMDSYTDVSFCACHPCFHDCHATCEHCSKYFVDHKIRDEIRVQSLSATQGLSDQIHFKPLQLYLFTYPYGPKTMSLLRKSTQEISRWCYATHFLCNSVRAQDVNQDLCTSLHEQDFTLNTSYAHLCTHRMVRMSSPLRRTQP